MFGYGMGARWHKRTGRLRIRIAAAHMPSTVAIADLRAKPRRQNRVIIPGVVEL